MKGKEKCRALKEIRRQIAEQNDIPYAVSQCTHKGDCKGTCPKCEAELKYLERELAVRQGLGKAVAIAGISVGVCAGLSACGPVSAPQGTGDGTIISDIAGDMAAPTEYPEEVNEPMTEPEETKPAETGTIEDIEGDIATTEYPDEIAGSIAAPVETKPEDQPEENDVRELEGYIVIQE